MTKGRSHKRLQYPSGLAVVKSSKQTENG